jgi:hypothetical protein
MESPNHAPPSRDELAESPAAEVKAWLHRTLATYEATKATGSFAPFEQFIGTQDFLGADLHEIYRWIPVEHKATWRKALGDLVAQLPATQENAPIFDTLIDLARFIPAYEVLDRAGSRLRSREVAALRLPSGRTLFERALNMALELAAETEEIRDFLLGLVHSGSFRRQYSFQMLAALARSDPEHWIDHLSTLRPYIASALRTDKPSAAALRRHAEALVEAAGFDRTLKKLPLLRSSAPGTSVPERANSDDWLLDALLRGPSPLIKPVRFSEPSGTQVALATRPEVTMVLAPDLLRAPLVSSRAYAEPLKSTPPFFRWSLAALSGLFSREDEKGRITAALKGRGLFAERADA